MNDYVHASKRDNLVTCIRPLHPDEIIVVDGRRIRVRDDIPIYHKMAIAEIRKGETVYKYGEVIGVATCDIHAGQWAHVHNIESTRGRGDLSGRGESR